MINTRYDYDSINARHEQNVRDVNSKQSSSFNKETFKVLLEKALAANKDFLDNEREIFGTNNIEQIKVVEDPAGSNKIDWSLFEEGFPKKRCRKCSRIITDGNGDYCIDCAKELGGKAYGI